MMTPFVFHQLHSKVLAGEFFGSQVSDWCFFFLCPVAISLLPRPSEVVLRVGMSGSLSLPLHVLSSPSSFPHSPPHLSPPLLQLPFMTTLHQGSRFIAGCWDYDVIAGVVTSVSDGAWKKAVDEGLK